MKNQEIKNICLSAIFLALSMTLPLFIGQIQAIGTMLLPMHLPILICGSICGKKYGAITGFLAPLLRHLVFFMPPAPNYIHMAFELMAYGFMMGYLSEKLGTTKIINVYITLIISMIVGRIVSLLAQIVVYNLAGSVFTMKMFISGAFLKAIPGIILQLLIVPSIIVLINKNKKKG